MNNENSETKINSKKVDLDNFLKSRYLRFLIRLISGFLFITITLSWIFYADNYLPLEEYLSYLGGINTVPGNLNTISQYIFSIGLWIIAVISLLMMIEYFSVRNWSKLNTLKGTILLIMIAGSLLISIPYDTKYRTYHTIGAVGFYLAFDVYIFYCQFTRFHNRKISFDTEESHKITPDKYYVFLMFFITLSYFVCFFIAKDLLPLIQKLIVLSSICGVILLDLEDM